MQNKGRWINGRFVLNRTKPPPRAIVVPDEDVNQSLKPPAVRPQFNSFTNRFVRPSIKPQPVHVMVSAIESPTVFVVVKKDIAALSYLGSYGYSIPKNAFTEEELTALKNEITISPVASSFAGGGAPAEKIPLYKENDMKIYLPRHFAQKKYGPAGRCALPVGDDISVEFVGKMRPDQIEVIDAYRANLNLDPDDATKGTYGGGGILEVACGKGKTVDAIFIAVSIVRKKTFILVHKDFLATQWIERIQQYAPTSRVGRIQGTTFDIVDKDFVLVMIQTVYSKTYPLNTFSEFGFTIIDEAHRVCSEEYFKVMQQIQTPCILALSAKIEKANGLECILHHFVGDVAYKSQVEELPIVVTVRAIEYQNDDPDYNEVEYDFRGKVKYSSLVSKIANFAPRTAFIVQIIVDLIRENPNGQIIILSFTRKLLTDINNGILEYNNSRGESHTTGYYVGGMKREALAHSETRQVVLATYSMAAEALDIKSLDTLVMVTPKTDITQSLGRIMRELLRRKCVIDITDTHATFKNQARKRRAVYKKNGYHVYGTNNQVYRGMEDTSWKRIYVPAGYVDPAQLNATTNEIDNDSESDYKSDSEEETATGECFV